MPRPTFPEMLVVSQTSMFSFYLSQGESQGSFYTLHIAVPDPHKSPTSNSTHQYSTEIVTADVFAQNCCWHHCCSTPLCSTNSPFKSTIYQIHWDFTTNCKEICGFWTKRKTHKTKRFLFIPYFPISFEEVLREQPDPWAGWDLIAIFQHLVKVSHTQWEIQR